MVVTPTATPAVAVATTTDDSRERFTATIRPILLARCSPCHEGGGKMYAKLPFDDPKVVADRAPGITTRLKGDDLAAYESWRRAAGGRTAEK
jgi:hypothetical protein